MISPTSRFRKSALAHSYGLTWWRNSLCRVKRSCPSIWRQNWQASSMGSMSKKSKTPKRFFWPKSTFAQQLGLESIRGENLEFFQLKTPLKLFSMGTFWGPKKFRKILKIPGISSKNREKKPGTGKKNSENRFFPLFYV